MDESSEKYRSSPLSIAYSACYLQNWNVDMTDFYSIGIPSKSFENYLTLRVIAFNDLNLG